MANRWEKVTMTFYIARNMRNVIKKKEASLFICLGVMAHKVSTGRDSRMVD